MDKENPFDYIRQVEDSVGQIEVGSPRNDKIYSGDILTIEGQDWPIGVVLQVEKNYVTVQLEGMSQTVRMEKDRLLGKDYTCEECGSKLLYHDREEERFCPFCES